ncbi:MAG: hypothetical protein ACKVP4_13970 [Hyphomicrobium sp.]
MFWKIDEGYPQVPADPACRSARLVTVGAIAALQQPTFVRKVPTSGCVKHSLSTVTSGLNMLVRSQISAFAGVLSLAISAAPASAEQLNAAELKILLAGKTISLSAPFGSLPIRYSHGGTMVAKSKAMGLFAGVSEDRGTWRIAGNRFCQRWSVWNSGNEQCFSVSRTGSTVRWVSNDGMTGTAYAAK